LALHAGTVIRTVGGIYDVMLDDGTTIAAVLRGRLKLENRTGDRVVVGDRVRVEYAGNGSATIESVEPRRTQLARRAPGKGARRAKVIVANVDRVVIVLAWSNPEPRLRMLDRFLVLAEANRLEAVIVVNKIDLAPSESAARELFAVYEAIGYPVLYVSAMDRRGIDAVSMLLCGSISVLTGPSGVGKSSLLNAIEPGLQLRTGAVSAAHAKGRHTTVSAELVPLSCGGYVADTPGLRELGLWGVSPDVLPECFPEFRPLLGECRFGYSCTHLHEPDCAIRYAVASGEITGDRYESYVTLADEIRQMV